MPTPVQGGLKVWFRDAKTGKDGHFHKISVKIKIKVKVKVK